MAKTFRAFLGAGLFNPLRSCGRYDSLNSQSGSVPRDRLRRRMSPRQSLHLGPTRNGNAALDKPFLSGFGENQIFDIGTI
jgi:hypothetical protein